MIPKERVLAAIEHRETDRVPLGFSATPEVLDRLKKYFKVNSDIEILNILNIDIRHIFPEYSNFEIVRDSDGSYKDIWGITYKPQNYGLGDYDEVAIYPLENAESVEDIESYNWPSIDECNFSTIESECDKFADRAISLAGASIFFMPTLIMPMEKILIMMYEFPEVIHRLIGIYVDFYASYLEKGLIAGKGKIDMVLVGDDLGMQNGLLMSAGMLREFVYPGLKRLVAITHDFNAKFMFHTCGSVIDIIPDLIDLGIDVLDPIQVSAYGMNPAVLKKNYGDRLAFHGAIDTQHVLPFGTVDDVVRETKQRINELAPGGGYILCSVHAIQPDVPTENILTMYDTAIKYGKYPIR